jgi:hypothetical protein
MYIPVIMPHVHIFITHYEIHLQLILTMIPIDTIIWALMHHYQNTIIQLCYDYNAIACNLIRIHIYM